MKKPMHRILKFLIPFVLMICLFSRADACSLLYIGGAYTDDGANLFIRVEDGDLNDENKLYLVSPAGEHKAGEEYRGCYGYTWTFTHDSYRYVSRRDDNLPGVCPGCGNTHDHQPYEEAGTNEYGLTVTATQSVDATPAVTAVDPYIDEGLSEGEMTTILLSECKNAREAVELLKSMVETDGLRQEGFGVMLCDRNEQWYAEAVACHYFLAVPLPKDVVFFQANVSILGRIDLDDEHIIATDGIIELAQKAGTFAGDPEENIIDWRLSLNDYRVEIHPAVWQNNVYERVSLTLNWLEETEKWNTGNVAETNDYIMTNVGEDGEIVPFHNDVKMARTISLDSLLELLRIYPLGYWGNVETHLYRFYPEAEPELGTVEWSSMDNNQYNVFVPGYPVLMTDTWKGYRTGLQLTRLAAQDPEFWQQFVEEYEVEKLDGEMPDTEDCYQMAGVYYCCHLNRDWTGLWHILPEGWEQSYSAVLSALSNRLTFMNPGVEAIAMVKERFAALQQEFEGRFAELTTRLKAEKDLTARQKIVTEESSRMAEKVQNLALALYRYIVYGEALPDDSLPADTDAPGSSTPEAIRNRGVLRVGTAGDYKPMSFLDPETGTYWGFDTELAEDLAASLGVEIEYVPTSWPTLMEDTQAGKFDLAICGITITDARKEQALMSEGYLENGKTVLCRAEDAYKYTSLEAMNRPEVRVMENPGGLNEKFARENLPDATLIIHEINQEIPGLVASGEADIMITEVMEAGYYVGQDSRLAAPLIYEPFTNGQLGILMPKGSEDLLEYVNGFLEEEKANGRLDELAEKYIFRYIMTEEEQPAA